jgi:hypothetical protein
MKSKITNIRFLAICMACMMAIAITSVSCKRAVRFVGVTVLEAIIQHETNKALDGMDRSGMDSPYQQFVGRSAYVQTEGDGFLALKAEPELNSMRLAKMPDHARVNIIEVLERPMSIEGKRGVWCKVEFESLIGWAWGGWLVLD